MKLVLLTAAAAAALTMAAQAGATAGHHRLTTHDRNVIRFFQHHPKAASTPAGGRILSRLLPRMVDELRTLQAARAARAAIPTTWLDSLDYVGRYMGASYVAWARSCSSTEGGWGAFVWFNNLSYPKYGYSDTPGGQLQFKGGTFDGIIDKAIATARSHGLAVPSDARSLYSPLGQAIAGAQMVLDHRTGEWSGSGC